VPPRRQHHRSGIDLGGFYRRPRVVLHGCVEIANPLGHAPKSHSRLDDPCTVTDALVLLQRRAKTRGGVRPITALQADGALGGKTLGGEPIVAFECELSRASDRGHGRVQIPVRRLHATQQLEREYGAHLARRRCVQIYRTL
jgi:hypothetical protein